MGGFIPWRTIDLHLSSIRSIWISTTQPDGRPHAAPVWYCWDGLHIYFVTGRATQKAKNLAHQPWTIVHAGDGDDVIILEGSAAIVTNPKEQQRVNAAYMEKYVDPRSGARATIFNPGDDLYRVTVERVMAWQYGIEATRTEWCFTPEL
ncbi:MAG TPA: pyridoxamine 5'-phosphate oxidase family protein [Herpetosiphonaceae bacterium]